VFPILSMFLQDIVREYHQIKTLSRRLGRNTDDKCNSLSLSEGVLVKSHLKTTIGFFLEQNKETIFEKMLI
jgi:hypothetical protein